MFALSKNNIVHFLKPIFILCILLIAVKSKAQPHLEEISLIDKKTKQITNDLFAYQKVEKFRDSSGYKIVYVSNNKIQKIEICTIQENIEKKVEWFYYKNTLIYSEKKWIDLTCNKIIDQEKFYTNKEELLAWFDKNNQFIDYNSCHYQDICNSLIAYGKNALLLSQE